MKEDLHVSKESIWRVLSTILGKKIQESTLSLQSTIESRNNDSKSSVGDKHETSRATIQIEIDKLETQLNRLLILEKELSGIQFLRKCNKVEPGSLARTTQENYFISIGLGKIEVEGQFFYAISLASPVGQLLQNKKVGEAISFNGREIKILDIA